MLDPDPAGSKALGSSLVPDRARSNISGSGVDPDPAGSKNSGSGAPLVQITCGLTACTPGSATGPTLGNEYGKPLPFNTAISSK